MKNNAKLTIFQIKDTHGYLDIHQEWFSVPQQPRCITSRAGSPNIRRRDADEPGEEGQPVGQNKAGVIMKGFVQNMAETSPLQIAPDTHTAELLAKKG